MYKNKKINSIFLSILFLIGFLTISIVSTENISKVEANGEEYKLGFEISRPQFSDYENINAIYSNYWMTQSDSSIFDFDNWELNDFEVKYELHLPNQEGSLEKNMTYNSSTGEWNGLVQFEDIILDNNQLEVHYYTNPYPEEGGNLVEPYLLHYDIYLTKSGDNYVLNIPKLALDEYYENPTGQELVLNVNNIKIDEIEENNENTSSENQEDIEIKDIYLNGNSGDDTLDGTSPEKAVKTFEKAKELATKNLTVKNIFVTGTTNISGDISLTGTNAIVRRYFEFNGYLFKTDTNANLTLKDITIDGNSENNKNIENSLIRLSSGSTLNIEDGVVLSNNIIKNKENEYTTGGAIYASKSTINMNGGLIENNQATYGGGIYLNKSTMNFKKGEIKNNASKTLYDSSVSQYYSAGGGICVDNGSTLNMYENATISKNVAGEIGGGISLGTQEWGPTNILNMYGGVIDNNQAGSNGGGIFVQAKYFSGGASKAYIHQGYITNNKTTSTGYTEDMFGGGGIYVNGANDTYGVNGANGELYIYNVLITENESVYQGGGYASCPISKTIIYVNNGGAIYGNKTSSVGEDIYILSNEFLGLHGGHPEYSLDERMLGGTLNEWKNPDNTFLPLENYKGQLTENNQYIALHTDNKPTIDKDLTKVYIMNNYSATRGGGIGSNGTVTIGTEEKIDIPVQKKWVGDEKESRPESIEIKLFAQLDESSEKYLIESRSLSEENNWETVFTNLPLTNGEKNIHYFIEEENIENYSSEIAGDSEQGFKITNTLIPNKPETIEIEGKKIWQDKNDQDGIRPEEITINLLKDGQKIQTRRVSEKDNWSWKFENLEKYENGKEILYTIEEEIVEGYTSNVEGYDVINTHIPEKIKIDVEKHWEDNDNKLGKRPEFITVQLFANGRKLEDKTLVLNKENNWKASFNDLDKYENGIEILYEIEEVTISKYYKNKIEGNQKEGFVITNTLIPNKPEKPNHNTPKKPNPLKPNHPKPSMPKTSPKTSDDFMAAKYIILTMIAFIGFMIIRYIAKKERKIE